MCDDRCSRCGRDLDPGLGCEACAEDDCQYDELVALRAEVARLREAVTGRVPSAPALWQDIDPEG